VTARVADPLPECALCENPVLRQAHTANGGLCTPCATRIAATVRMLPIRDPEHLERQRELRAARQVDDTVFVERYLPPVPGAVQQEAACKWAHGPVAELDDRGLCRICAEDEE
jgi:hypothetical protein